MTFLNRKGEFAETDENLITLRFYLSFLVICSVDKFHYFFKEYPHLRLLQLIYNVTLDLFIHPFVYLFYCLFTTYIFAVSLYGKINKKKKIEIQVESFQRNGCENAISRPR